MRTLLIYTCALLATIIAYSNIAGAEYVETKIEKEFDGKRDVLATKEDLAREIGNSKSEVIKWMFIFWVGQLAAMIAIAKLFFHS